MQEQRFTVTGMTCTSCAMSIDEELEDLAGVTYSETSYAKAQLDVTYDESQVTPDRIMGLVRELGYEARPS
jgi:copper chaperone CopZ